MEKFRILVFALIVSGALNIGLTGVLVFSHIAPEEKVAALTPKELEKVIGECSKLSFRELISALTNKEKVDGDLLKRDLALSFLVAFHHFHLEKALSGPFPSAKRILFQEKEIPLFMNFSDEEFQAILRFAYEERWPLKPEGLFSLLKSGNLEPSLQNALFVTEDFQVLERFFQMSGSILSKEDILSLILSGSWELFSGLIQEQKQLFDPSEARRQRLLLSYLRLNSQKAADILLKTDMSFVEKQLTEEGLSLVLDLAKESQEELAMLCKNIVRSNRSERQREKAKLKVGGCEEVAVAIPKAVFETHEVQKGESLWKIAKNYAIKVEELVRFNDLEKDQIYPGMLLRIPREGNPLPPEKSTNP